jgi:hypothetical protein
MEQFKSYNKGLDECESMTVRRATAADESLLRRLATLDSAVPLTGDVLVAEVDGEVRAAVSIESGRVIADPFRPAHGPTELLTLRARQLRAPISRLPRGTRALARILRPG